MASSTPKKLLKVGCAGSHCGTSEKTSFRSLKAVRTIQTSGTIMTSAARAKMT